MMILIGSKPQSKVYKLNGKQDVVKTRNNRRVKEWDVKRHKVKNIHDLHGIIQSYRTNPNAVVIRGGLNEEAKKIVRKGGKVEKSQEKSLEDVSRPFVMFDIDDLERKVEMTLDDEIMVARSMLPPAFRKASCVVQFSSSARMENTSKIKVHLFFMLNRSIKTSEFKTWIHRWIDEADRTKDNRQNKLKRRGIDPATLSAFNHLSIGDPVLPNPSLDPIGSNRVQFIKGKQDLVDVPPPSFLVPIESRQVVEYKKHDFVGVDEGARKLFDSAVQDLRSASQGRGDALYRWSITAFRLVLAGRLRESEVRDTFLQCSVENGLMNKRGRQYVERQINRGKKQADLEGALYPKKSFQVQSQFKREIKRRNRKLLEDYIPSTIEEMRTEARRVVDEAFNLSSSRYHLISLEIPTGVGKTHTSILRAIEEYRRGRSVFFCVRNHDLLGEVKAKFKNEAPDIKPKVLEGRNRKCKQWRDGDEYQKEVINQGLDGQDFANQFCNQIKCPFKANCKNYNASKQSKDELEGTITLLPHALLDKVPPPDNAIVLVDEMFDPNMTKTAKLNQVKTVSIKQSDEGQYTDSQKWRMKHKDGASLFAQSVVNRVKSWIKTLDPKKKVSSILYGDELLELFKGLDALAFKTLDVAEKPKLPRSKGSMKKMVDELKNLIEGQSMDFIDRDGFRMIEQIARFIVDHDEAPKDLCITSINGDASFEARTPIKLPKSKIIVLDATAEQHSEILKAVATSNDIPLHTIKADIKPKVSQGLFVKTGAFKSTSLYSRTKDGIRWKGRLEGTLNHVAACLRSSLRNVPKGSKIGIGTHKALADLIRESLENEGKLKDHPLHGIIKDYEVIIGHTGKDEVASNKFDDVKAMIIMGDPRQNMGSFQSDCRSLGLSDDETEVAYSKDTDASMIQWIGRARHYRREGIKFLVFADNFPTMNGIIWEKEESKGRATSSRNSLLKEDIISDLEQGEIISASQIAARYEVSESTARNAFKSLYNEYHLHIIEKRSESGQVQRCLSILDKTVIIAYLYSIEKDTEQEEDQKTILTVLTENGMSDEISDRFEGIDLKKLIKHKESLVFHLIKEVMVMDEEGGDDVHLISRKRFTPLKTLLGREDYGGMPIDYLILNGQKKEHDASMRTHVRSLQEAI